MSRSFRIGLFVSATIVQCLILTTPPVFAGEDVKVNLRGPAPIVGTVVQSTAKFETKGAELTVTAQGKNVQGKLTASTISEEETKILAIDGEKVTKFQTKHIKDEDRTITTIAGETTTDDDLDDLAGSVVSSVKKGNDWTHSLVDSKPTEKQSKALAGLSGWDDHDHIPNGKQAIGRTWEVDATHFKKLLGPKATAVSGKLKATFVGLEKHRGELCAVIQTEGRMKAKMEIDGKLMTMDIEMKETTHRSLRLGWDLASTATGTVRLVGNFKTDGEDVRVEIKGNFTGHVSTTITELPSK
jgi:hypothetical protein